MASALSNKIANRTHAPDEEAGGAQMSFLEHLDELRSRIIRSLIFVFVAFFFCWFVSDHIYNFLARPVQKALSEARERQLPFEGLDAQQQPIPLDTLKADDTLRYAFAETTKLGSTIIPAGTSVAARVAMDANGNRVLLTDENLYAGGVVVPKGVRLPMNLNVRIAGDESKLTVTTALEPFTLYVKVSLYAAICLALPFLLYQIWAFVAPGLYPHERGYVLPFILLSTISFVIGALFAYYIIFPPAAKYLLGLGQDFRLLLKADDYFDFIILVMLGMGLVFQMPAITYVLARIGLVTAGFLIRIWKTSLIVILIAAAILSPSNDVPNMLLFAAPMIALYVVSIFVAWLCARPRQRI
jgi:sec-independent protein translocase protein TatC